MKIQGSNLKTLRDRRGFSQAKLAAESKVGKKTIGRIEQGGDKARWHSSNTVTKLASALGVSVDELTSADPARDPQNPITPTRRVSEKLDGRSVVNLELNEIEYKVSRCAQLEFAPTAIAILMEMSLAWRQRRLDAFRQRMEGLEELRSVLGPLGIHLDDVRDAADLEAKSIANRDVFGESLLGQHRGNDEDWCNPFNAFLSDVTLNIDADRVDVGQHDGVGASTERKLPYSPTIHAALLRRITDHSELAEYALLGGFAAMHEVPRRYWKAGQNTARARWLEEKVDVENQHKFRDDQNELAKILRQKMEQHDGESNRKP